MVERLWADQETFLLIEHDIEVTPEAVKSVEACEHWWCVSPYNGSGGDPIYHSLGFVRFHADLLKHEPDAIGAVALVDDGKDVPPGHWRRFDVRISSVLQQRGYSEHRHPAVLQHHVYNGQCSCMTDHESFSVDREGRYLP